MPPASSTKVPPHRLRFSDLDREIDCAEDETVFHAARRSGVRIVGACGGRGACGSCTVRIVEGQIETDGVDRGRKWVRACRARPRSDCEIAIAPRSLAPIVRADVHALHRDVAIVPDPCVVAHDMTVAEPTLRDCASDMERINRALPCPVDSIDLFAARDLPRVLRANHWSARVFRRDSEIIGVVPVGRRSVGLAIDLGTTNVVGFLVDLETGEPLGSLGVENPQTAWGGDLVARINHATAGDDQAGELRDAARTAINALGHDLARAARLTPQDIVDVAVCGNTAMQHLLLGLPVRQLGRAPFVAALRDAVDIRARDLGLRFYPGACVHIAANIGGFVGSDHVAALLATRDRWTPAATSLVMDIGTNTEISLIRRDEIVSASCPSGPALEGGHIACGMRAADGAIERVWVENDRLTTATIADRPAVGICGSGVLDAVAAALRLGLIDAGGRIRSDHPDVGEVDGSRAILLAPGIHIGQADIRAVQLAKAAIRTGVDLLLEQAGLEAERIEHFVIAGAFGKYIDVSSAIAIGLTPDLPREKFVQVGNAAGAGVTRILASSAERAAAKDLARRCVYMELSTRADFQKRFLKNIGFHAAREKTS